MTMHLFGTILTHRAVASNNRGESEGTVSTLQKVIRDGHLFSTVSSEAIRYAIRESWEADEKLKLNRQLANDPPWKDKDFKKPQDYIDCDVLGYMNAGTKTISRRGILELGRAVSTTPWPGTVSSHFASPGSNPSVKSDNPIPYQVEVHDTRYQFTFAMTPDSLLSEKALRTEKALLALQSPRRVAGNHARLLFDFSPEAIVLRWSTDPSPRIMFCFDEDEEGTLSLTKLKRRIDGGDIDGSEIIIGTSIEGIKSWSELKELKGVKIVSGVKAAITEVLSRIKTNVKK